MNFAVEAEAYDRYMGRWSERLSAQLADFAGIRAGDRVLDVGCGPGNLTAELVSRTAADAVAAVDPSPQFVSAARDRNPGADVRQASAEALPFVSGVFDAALAQLVVHFMKDPVVGLREMARVTRREGVIAVCVWDYAGSRDPLGPFWQAVRSVDPSSEGEAALPGARQGHLMQLFVEAGIEAIEETSLSARRRFGSFDEWWEPFTLGVGPGGAYVSRLDVGRAAELRERCRAMLPRGDFEITAHAWAVRGKVP